LRTAKLIGIEEEELYAFIDVLPAIWHRESGVFDPVMDFILRRNYDCESCIIGVYLYNMNLYLLTLLVEYDKDSGLAIIEVSVLQRGVPNPRLEEKIRDLLLDITEKQLEALTSIPTGVFVCPHCGAQYLHRVLRINEDGKTECQNCGQFVKAGSETE
jgi:predicted RNA-binding Zn-ribbon protein involved in translation (DUF1610 family)